MGKPFQSELGKLSETIQWTAENALPAIKPFWLDKALPAYCVGSGGSQSAADFLARLIRGQGGFAWATTPLEYLSVEERHPFASTYLVSASGKNKDILAVADHAIQGESALVGALIARSNSPLAKRIKEYATGFVLEMDMPCGKDGFLATNSLISTMVAMLGLWPGNGVALPIAHLCETAGAVSESLARTAFPNSFREVIIVFAGWGGPAALDLESKLSEAALAPSMLCDVRNFGHGRHHWLAKRGEGTLVVTLEDPRYSDLFSKTLALLPLDIQVARLKSSLTGPSVAVDLTLQVFGFVRDLGVLLNIDPGRPGVPEFGRKIYHLSPKPAKRRPVDSATPATRRMRRLPSYNADLLKECEVAAKAFAREAQSRPVQAVVLDYDGTIVNTLNRFDPISNDVASELARLAEIGVFIGIATGRGKSVRDPLRKAVGKESWSKVLVGYYNAGQVIRLSEEALPSNEASKEDPLRSLEALLQDDPWLQSCDAKLELRPSQLSISGAGCNNTYLWLHINRLLMERKYEHLKCLASTHSVDILPKECSKLNLVTQIVKELGCAPENVLCIGDSGLWPGNDAELLTHYPALSSGTSPVQFHTGWNLAPSGVLEAAATLYYLKRITPRGDGLYLSLDE